MLDEKVSVGALLEVVVSPIHQHQITLGYPLMEGDGILVLNLHRQRYPLRPGESEHNHSRAARVVATRQAAESESTALRLT